MKYQKIQLVGGAEVMVDMDERRSSCKRCGEMIRWAITDLGKKMPIIEKDDKWQLNKLTQTDQQKINGIYIY